MAEAIQWFWKAGEGPNRAATSWRAFADKVLAGHDISIHFLAKKDLLVTPRIGIGEFNQLVQTINFK